MVAPLVCGVCVERQRSLVPILYRLLISECVVAKCFLFLFSSRESIPWFLSVHLTCPGTCVCTPSVIADLGRGLSPHPLLCTLDVECDVM